GTGACPYTFSDIGLIPVFANSYKIEEDEKINKLIEWENDKEVLEWLDSL
ncbi:MAG: hypothetical protein HQK75_09725, partial [Candidatus Magnetomorum sp.]|nr:hypothetical protein [Candidatus Magnetomorum sp.]